MRRRPVIDFTPSVLEALREVQDEISSVHNLEPRFVTNPVWMTSDLGEVRRAGARWFWLRPDNTVMDSRGLYVEDYGRGPIGSAPAVPRRFTVVAVHPAGPIISHEILTAAAPDASLIRHVASMVGLLPFTPWEPR